MKVGRTFLLIAFALAAVGLVPDVGAATPKRMPLVDFAKAEDAKGAYAVDFGKHRQTLRYGCRLPPEQAGGRQS